MEVSGFNHKCDICSALLLTTNRPGIISARLSAWAESPAVLRTSADHVLTDGSTRFLAVVSGLAQLTCPPHGETAAVLRPEQAPFPRGSRRGANSPAVPPLGEAGAEHCPASRRLCTSPGGAAGFEGSLSLQGGCCPCRERGPASAAPAAPRR